jgi:uncharacterized protein YndB with AHSA1/START domain
MSDHRADRELLAETVIAAPADRVWAVLPDLGAMPDRSPELVRMVPLKRGGLRPGQWYLGINRRGVAVWPTRNVVAEVERGKRLAWDTPSSGARWIYELSPDGEATRVVHRRPVPRRLTLAGILYAALALGGAVSHADELEEGMRTSLERLKAAVER